jgi:hypothetical protein
MDQETLAKIPSSYYTSSSGVLRCITFQYYSHSANKKIAADNRFITFYN